MTIAPEENSSPTQTLTLTGSNFLLGKLSGHRVKDFIVSFLPAQTQTDRYNCGPFEIPFAA